MQYQRVSPTEIVVAAPPEWAREAAWHSLWQSGVQLPVIDSERNIVSGSTGDGILVSARTARAVLQARDTGTSVMFSSQPVFGGSIDFGFGRKQAQKMADALQRIVTANAPATPDAGQPMAAPASFAPIASPTDVAAPRPAAPFQAVRPLYGTVLAPKRGGILLLYAFIIGVLCAILSPLNLFYGAKALKDYREQGDPGDKALVIAAMVVSTLVILIGIGIVAVSV